MRRFGARPAHHLAGVRKLEAPYSSLRAPRPAPPIRSSQSLRSSLINSLPKVDLPESWLLECLLVSRAYLARIIHEDFDCNCASTRCIGPLQWAKQWAPRATGPPAATSLAVCSHGQAGGLAPRPVNVLFQVRFRLSGLRAPVSQSIFTVSLRSFMNNAGFRRPGLPITI
jgi:hypothetical protein